MILAGKLHVDGCERMSGMDIAFLESGPALWADGDSPAGDTIWRAEHRDDDGQLWTGIGKTRDEAEASLLAAMLREGWLPVESRERLWALLATA